jgi:hypothetical protein
VVIAQNGGKLACAESELRGNPWTCVSVRSGVLEPARTKHSVAKGGCVVLERATGFIRRCEIARSASVGCEISKSAEFEIVDCTFVDNCSAGLAARDDPQARFTNREFKQNGQVGADADGDGCSSLSDNCTFSENGATGISALGLSG